MSEQPPSPFKRDTRVPERPCPICGTPNDWAGSFEDRSPEPGDLTICLSCGVPSKFVDDMDPEPLEMEDIERLPPDKQLELLRGVRLVQSFIARRDGGVPGEYFPAKLLPSGEYAGVRDMFASTGLCVGITPDLYRVRYCYEHREDAETALATWDGKEDPPGPWIKRKPGDRLGPGALETP